ncbi:MAG: hypothetical protein HYR96_03775 [Deltaproteobacteria bacterium]|nr:hypothetical protein [Deltaproteobacteria bacterium]MBI3295307.1 hypothetical protein [Deltaproteobacteria bacterium]
MKDDVTALRAQLEATKDRIGANVRQLKRSVDLKQQTREHPIEFVGGAVLAGAIVGFGLSHKPEKSGKRLSKEGDSRFHEVFHTELELLKGIVLSGLIRRTVDGLSHKFPEWKPEIEEFIDKSAAELGAK